MGLLDRARDALGIDREAAIQYRCETCDREFVYDAGIDDPACPYCDSAEVVRRDE